MFCTPVYCMFIVQISSTQGLQEAKRWSQQFEESLINPTVFENKLLETEKEEKEWSTYIAKSLFNSMKYIFFIDKLFTGKWDFVELESFQRIMLLTWWRITDHVHSINQKKSFSSVKLPLGQIFVGCTFYDQKHKTSILCLSLKGAYDLNTKKNGYLLVHTWLFKLDPQLRLNMTFLSIKFCVKNLHTCSIGYISIQNSKLKDQDLEEKLCGFLSYVVSYPYFQNVGILLAVKPLVTFHTHIMYSVINANQIISLVTHTRYKPAPEWRFLLIKTKLVCEKYHIQQEKVHLLHITDLVKACWMEIFDGPGTLSPKLKTTSQSGDQNIYITSSFQCFVFLCCSGVLSDIYWKSSFVFEAKQKRIDQHVFVTRVEYMEQQRRLASRWSVHVTKVTTIEQSIISITTNYLISTHSRNELCTFAGLSAHEGHNNPQGLITTICFQYSLLFAHRNIYSTSNSMLLILHSYQEYGSQNVSLTLSRTTCKVQKINACLKKAATVLPLSSDSCVILQMQNHMKTYFSKTSIFKGNVSCNEQFIRFRVGGPDWAEIHIRITGYLKGRYTRRQSFVLLFLDTNMHFVMC